MTQLTVAPAAALGAAQDGQVVELWLSMKTSSHTRRAYAAEAGRLPGVR